ncbi:MAG TPA: hypothetical protein VM925_08665, partial [Labilithrix sp.]|nr:hypothetical protein [Labilithrix sp.]
MKRGTTVRAALAVSGMALALGVACTGETLPYAGGVMVAVQTDLAAPKDVAAVGLYITSDGRPIFGDTRAVAPNGEVKFPATIAVLADAARPRAVVKIRAVAFKADGEVRVLRDIITTIPKGRTGLLRAPLLWINEGSGSGSKNQLLGSASIRPRDATSDGFARLTSACPDGQTFLEGACGDAHVDGDSLPDYAEKDVFGGGDANGNGGRCFDVAACFASTAPVTLDLGTCTGTIAGVDPNDPNLSLAAALPSSAGTGECLASGTCLVPLDKGTVWKVRGNGIELPPAVCRRIEAGHATGIVASRACPAKDATTPACGPASAVASSGGGGGGPDASTTQDFEAALVAKRSEPLLSDVAVDDQYIFLARAQRDLPAGVIRLKKSDVTTQKQPEEFQLLFAYDAGIEERSKIALDPSPSAQHVVVRGESGALRLCTPASSGDCGQPVTLPGPAYGALAAGAQEAYAFGAVASVMGLHAVPYASPTPEQRMSPTPTGVTALHVADDSLYIGTDDAAIYRCVIPCQVAAQMSQLRAPPAAAAAITALSTSGQVPGKIFLMQVPKNPGDP